MEPKFRQYKVIRDLPLGLVLNCSKRIQVGEICTYFEHGNLFLFAARDARVPYVARKYVEMWNTYFEPVIDGTNPV